MNFVKPLIGFMFVMAAPFLLGGLVSIPLVNKFGMLGAAYFCTYIVAWFCCYVAWFDGSSFQRMV